MSKNNRVKVVVRTKPTGSFANEYIKLDPNRKTITLYDKKATDNAFINNKVHDWIFNVDKILHNASQEAVYNDCAREVVLKALEGYNSTIFAYGQTGAGKTFTITGTAENYQHRGIIPRAIAHIFQHVKSHPDTSFNIRASYLEIYNEVMFDLLSTLPDQETGQSNPAQAMAVVENNDGSTYVKGLRIQYITSEEEALNLLFEGETNRVIGEHALNKSSSRSHCIFTIYIESRSRVDAMAKVFTSKLHFVDLAGSERLGKTESTGDTKREAVYINKSLTFLEQVIIALADKKRDHIPNRQSKLTHVLKDSIGKKCNTLMIANIWAEATQIEETSSTLRFAARVMCVPSEPALNIRYDAAQLIEQYEKEIKALKMELAMHNTLSNRGKISYDRLSESRMQEIRREVRAFLHGKAENIEIESVRQINAVFQEFKNQINNFKRDVENRTTQQGGMLDMPPLSRPKSNTVSVVDDFREVGDNEGQGFGIGVVTQEDKLSSPDRKVKAKKLKDRIGSPPKTGGSDTSSLTSMNRGDSPTRRIGSAGNSDIREITEFNQHPLTYHSPPHHGDQQQQQQTTHMHVEHHHHAQHSNEHNHSHPHTNPDHSVLHGGEHHAHAIYSIHHHSYGHQVHHSHINQQQTTQTQEATAAREESIMHGTEPQFSAPSSPPSRQEAFEVFKQDKGAEIYKLLNDNKEFVKLRKKTIKELTNIINVTKKQIDQIRISLDEKRNKTVDEVEMLTETGDPIIDEEEFALIKELKDLKSKYRREYEDLRDKKSELDYCRKILDQSRQRLVHDFDEWYSETYLPPDEHINSLATPEKLINSSNLVFATEDEQEKMEKLKLDLLQENPDSAAFYNARMRTEQRYYYGKTGDGQKKKAGLITSTIRNKPPSLMKVH